MNPIEVRCIANGAQFECITLEFWWFPMKELFSEEFPKFICKRLLLLESMLASRIPSPNPPMIIRAAAILFDNWFCCCCCSWSCCCISWRIDSWGMLCICCMLLWECWNRGSCCDCFTSSLDDEEILLRCPPSISLHISGWYLMNFSWE